MSPTSSFFIFYFHINVCLEVIYMYIQITKHASHCPHYGENHPTTKENAIKKNQQQQSPIVVTIGINTHTLQTLSQSCTWNKKHWRMWSPKFFTVQHSNRPETDRTPLKKKTPRGVCLGVSAIDFLYTLYNQASLLNKRWRIISVLWSIKLTLTRG